MCLIVRSFAQQITRGEQSRETLLHKILRRWLPFGDDFSQLLPLFSSNVHKIQAAMMMIAIDHPGKGVEPVAREFKLQPHDLADRQRLRDVHAHSVFVDVSANALRAARPDKHVVRHLERQPNLVACRAGIDRSCCWYWRLLRSRGKVHIGMTRVPASE